MRHADPTNSTRARSHARPVHGTLSTGLAVVLSVALASAGAATARPRQPAQATDTRYQDALELFDAGKSAAAIYLLQQIVVDNPNEAEVYKKLAEMAVASKNWAYAIQTLSRIAKIRPDDLVCRRVLMSIFAAYQMPMEELLVGREILDREPRNVRLLARLAVLCRQNNLADDEALIRARLAALDPGDYDNLRQLADVYAQTGKSVEEINALRAIVARWPDKREHRVRLIYLHGVADDRFSQLEAIREMPAASRDPVVRGLEKEATRSLRRERKLLDVTEPAFKVERERSREFKLKRQHAENLWMRPALSRNVDTGVWSRYEHVTYKGTNVLAGTADIDTYDLHLRRVSAWDRERTTLTLGLGATHVGVRSFFFSRYGLALSPTDYPFLELAGYGGTTPIGTAKLERRFTNRLSGAAWADREVLADIDAHVRMVCRHAGGAGLDYAWPDGTLAHAQYELWDITDSNSFRNGRFAIQRTILGEGPEHDHAGSRQGFFVSPPSSFLALRYQFEYLDHDHRSRLYQTYSGEIQNEVSMNAELRLASRLFLKAEAMYCEGNRVLHEKSSGTVGVGYRDVAESNEVVLQYGQARDSVTEGSQLNQTLLGDSRFEQFQLAGRWHF